MSIGSEYSFSSQDEMYLRFAGTIKNYGLLDGVKNVIFLYSGGKDATFGLYFLDKYIKENRSDVSLKTVMVTYPTHVYHDENNRKTTSYRELMFFWKSRGVPIDVFDSEAPDLEEDMTDGCKVCKGVRKDIVDNYLSGAGKEKTAVVTGYTLYDILAYLDEYCLLSNFNFDFSGLKDQKTVNRIKNCLHKMNIQEELPNNLRIIRPLVVFKESEILHYLKERNIPFISQPCRVASQKHKRAYFKALNLMASINNCSYEGIISFLDKNRVELPSTFEDIQYKNYFTDC